MNDHNQELALLMAAMVLKFQKKVLALVNKLLKGKKSKTAQESAILLVSKGLGEATDDVGVLNNLLNKNSKISDSLKNCLKCMGR